MSLLDSALMELDSNQPGSSATDPSATGTTPHPVLDFKALKPPDLSDRTSVTRIDRMTKKLTERKKREAASAKRAHRAASAPLEGGMDVDQQDEELAALEAAIQQTKDVEADVEADANDTQEAEPAWQENVFRVPVAQAELLPLELPDVPCMRDIAAASCVPPEMTHAVAAAELLQGGWLLQLCCGSGGSCPRAVTEWLFDLAFGGRCAPHYAAAAAQQLQEVLDPSSARASTLLYGSPPTPRIEWLPSLQDFYKALQRLGYQPPGSNAKCTTAAAAPQGVPLPLASLRHLLHSLAAVCRRSQAGDAAAVAAVVQASGEHAAAATQLLQALLALQLQPGGAALMSDAAAAFSELLDALDEDAWQDAFWPLCSAVACMGPTYRAAVALTTNLPGTTRGQLLQAQCCRLLLETLLQESALKGERAFEPPRPAPASGPVEAPDVDALLSGLPWMGGAAAAKQVVAAFVAARRFSAWEVVSAVEAAHLLLQQRARGEQGAREPLARSFKAQLDALDAAVRREVKSRGFTLAISGVKSAYPDLH